MVRISDAELEVMKVIWKRKEATSLEIIEDLQSFTWKFNTIRTLIKRLHVKGAIEITKKEGKAFTYRALIDQDDYKNEVTKDLLKKLFNNSISEFVLNCYDGKGVSEDELMEALQNAIKAQKAKKKEGNK